MGSTPDELRQDADTTRAHLAQTADRLAERVSPPRVVRRQAQAARERLGTAREKVMGTARSTGSVPAQMGDTMRDTTEHLGQQARQVPEHLRAQAQGSPLAAGLVAFGAGMLLGALFPAAGPEERLGQRIREHSDELMAPVKETVREIGEDAREELREPARQAAATVKETTQEAARTTAQQARDSGQEAGEDIRRTAQETRRRAGES